MLFDYIFLTFIGLDWFILTFLIFGEKALIHSTAPQGKQSARSWLFKTVIVSLILIFIVKIALAVAVIYPLQHKIVSSGQSWSLLVFVGWQFLFAFIVVFFSVLLFIKDGFEESYVHIWLKKTMVILAFTLIVDFLGSSISYFFLLRKLLAIQIENGVLPLNLFEINPNNYWFVLGLILSAVVYSIFYFSLKHKINKYVFKGFTFSYLIVLCFSFLVVGLYDPLLAPGIGYLWNDFYFYLTVLIWAALIITGIGCLGFLWLLSANRKHLINQFYYQYLLIHISHVHAISVLGVTGITLVPVLFFLYY